jgi:hypothetical protein
VRALVLLGAAVAAAFVSLMLLETGGHFAAQVSDLYVVAQYARAMAEGHPFRYNPGDAPTTGSTSLLHTAVLALAHAAGARGEGLVAFAVLLGAASLVASVPLAMRVASRLASRREGFLAGALVALGGPVAWSYLYGSDIALFLFLSLLLLDRWLAWWDGGSPAGLGVAAALAGLARPEGLLLGAALGPASLLRRAAAGRRRWSDRLLPWSGLAAGLLVLALQRALTGTWTGTSVSGKSLLTSYGPVEALSIAAKYLVDVLRGLLLGLYPAEAPIGFWPGEAAFVFPPLGLALVLVGVAAAPPVRRRAAFLWLGAVALAFVVAGPNAYAGVHFNRYLLWAFPGLLAFTAAGLGAACRLLAREDERLERTLFFSAAGLFVTLAALSTARFAAYYAESAGGIWRRDVAMAAWIGGNLPPGVAIANVATSVEYLTGHRSLNLHGVVSAEFAGGRALDRDANVLEQMRAVPPGRRPPYLLVGRAQLEGSDLLRAFAAGPAVHEAAGFGDDDLLLVPTRWDVLDRGASPLVAAAVAAVASLTEVDRLNVADPADEAAHAYAVDSRLGTAPVGATVSFGPPPGGGPEIADGGRVVLGGESFTVRATRAGRDLLVVLRTRDPAEARVLRARGATTSTFAFPATSLTLAAAGRTVARLDLANVEGWNEHVLRIPGAAVTEGSTRLALTGRYASYRYWFYQ